MIRIIKFTPLNKGLLEGFVCIEIPAWKMVINDISVFRKDNQRWIGFPSRMYEVEGVKKYAPYITMEAEVKSRLEKAIFQELATYKPKDPIPPENGKGPPQQYQNDLPF